MKKLLFLFIPLVFFFSCEPEEEESSCLLFGNWSVDYFEDIDSGKITCICGYSDSLCDEYDDDCASINFLDGEFDLETLDDYIISGTWSGGCFTGESIFLESFEPDSYTFFIISISENNLVLSSSEDGEITYLTKVD
tara:strand:+ start:266 stop:676 length:411 start_codon:yes stop_codon:yes gene_type:complete